MAAARALLLLLLAALGPAAAVWPQPLRQLSPPAAARCPLPPGRFRFSYAAGSAVGPGCAVLDEAFQRYRALIFGAARPAGEARGEGSGRGAPSGPAGSWGWRGTRSRWGKRARRFESPKSCVRLVETCSLTRRCPVLRWDLLASHRNKPKVHVSDSAQVGHGSSACQSPSPQAKEALLAP